MSGPILHELRRHVPFTVFGALTGIIIMIFFRNLPYKTAFNIFYVLHPTHVLLSAMVTSAMYKNYKCRHDGQRCAIAAIVAVGFAGSIGIATLSDSIIPYIGELLLHMPHAEPHIGFIEEWKIVLPLAGAGVAIAYFWPRTKFPHAGHVLISTWASLFHIVMAGDRVFTFFTSTIIFIFLFLAVWVPCCVSDIVFPLLFVGKTGEEKRSGSCMVDS